MILSKLPSKAFVSTVAVLLGPFGNSVLLPFLASCVYFVLLKNIYIVEA